MMRLSKDRQHRREVLLVLAVAFLWNQWCYSGARWIASGWKHWDMTTSLDWLVPFLPWTVAVYFGCYLVWGINYYLCALQEPAQRDRFFCADALAKGVCFLIFLLIPTTNARPAVEGTTVWDALMRLLYRVDAADNLFPSLHCLVSWFCWIGVRKRKDISPVYRIFSFAVAVAVCVSTLTTRQHVIYDVIAGVLLAEVCHWAAGFPKICGVYTAVITRLSRLLIKQN